jgi:ribosomal protein L37AE/L43A
MAGQQDSVNNRVTTFAEAIAVPSCPFCDTAIAPEQIGHRRWWCPVCARQFGPAQIRVYRPGGE